jgi:hypothetical protein
LRERALKVFSLLDSSSLAADLGAIRERDDDGEIPYTRFFPEAQDLYDEWALELEKKVRSDSGAPAFESHLSKYRSLMPALALIFHAISKCAGIEKGQSISLENAKLAATHCEILEAHAAKLYSMETNFGLHSAHTLAEKIKKGLVSDGNELRFIYRHHWALLKNPTEVDAAIAVLEEANWCRVEQMRRGKGASSEVLRLHPEIIQRQPE